MAATSENIKQSLAGSLMEELFTSNTYQDFKQYEYDLKGKEGENGIANEVKSRHPEEIKHWDLGKAVAIHQTYSQFDIDYAGLNELLADYGILHKVSYFDFNKDTPEFITNAVSRYANPIESFVRINPKKGLVDIEIKSFKKYNNEALIDLWIRTKQQHEDLETYIETVKEQMFTCKEFRKNRKAATDYGSVSLVDKKRTYNMEEVLREPGIDFMIQHAKVNSTELDKYVVKGIITQKEVNKFKTLTGMTSRYVIMSKNSNQAMGEKMHSKRMRQAKNLATLWAHKI